MSGRPVARLCRRGRAWGLLAVVFTQLCSQSPLCSGHGVHAVNVCAADERPVSAAAKRMSCKQDLKCKHETQCGCIPKECTCGNEACIFAGTSVGSGVGGGVDDASTEHEHGADGQIISDEGAHSAGSRAASEPGEDAETPGASKHDLVDDDSEGPQHSHRDGTLHGHPGGDLPHHHDASGGLVFDAPPKPSKQAAKFIMHKELLPPGMHASAKAGVVGSDNGDAVDTDAVLDKKPDKPQAAASNSPAGLVLTGEQEGGNKTDTQDKSVPTHALPAKMASALASLLGIGIAGLLVAAWCVCCGSATMRCFRHKVLGKSMLSREMFNDNEMMSMDWESKSHAAGWRHDDGL